MGGRYSSTQLNGIDLPSTDPDRNAKVRKLKDVADRLDVPPLPVTHAVDGEPIIGGGAGMAPLRSQIFDEIKQNLEEHG